jgi:DNA repair protein RecO (recombination protein O)
MSHHIYQTKGFILHGGNTGEADRIFSVFTEKLGLLPLFARSARKTSSKLRYSLSNYSFVRVAFVRGKNIWRLTDAEEIVSFHRETSGEKIKTAAGIFSLVSRLVHGEGENPALFSTLEEFFIFLQKESLSEEEVLLLETIISCRILLSLGYVGENSSLVPFFGESVSKKLLNDFAPSRTEALKEISRALQESQL